MCNEAPSYDGSAFFRALCHNGSHALDGKGQLNEVKKSQKRHQIFFLKLCFWIGSVVTVRQQISSFMFVFVLHFLDTRRFSRV